MWIQRRWLPGLLVSAGSLALGAVALWARAGQAAQVPGEPSALVVLGNRPPLDERGQVAYETGARVRAAVALWRRHPRLPFVVSGGPAPHGGSEAQVMGELAASLGVPQWQLVLEARSRDTAENARYTIALLCAGAGPGCQPHILLVTSDYHMRRARWLFECAGARVTPAPVRLDVPWARQAALRLREAFVGAASLLGGACTRAGGGRGTLPRNPRM